MKKSFVLYTDYLEQTEILSDAQMGVLFRSILEYVSSGEVEEEMDALTQMAFNFIKVKIDSDCEKYREACEKRREAGRKGGLAKASNAKQCLANLADNDNDNDNDNENENDNDISINADTPLNPPKGGKKFTPPSVEDVREYRDEKGLRIDPEAFVDFYESKGWMVGKNKMQDWKAAVRNWARKDRADKPARQDAFDKWREA